MRNAWLWVLAFAALVAVTAAAAATAQEPPPPPHQFDGSVRIDGYPAAAGISIFAVVDDQRCGTATVTSSSTYILHVPTACAEDGATVHFNVGGRAAAESGSFAGGTRTALNLTVEVPAPESPTPPPTPIPPPTATATPSAGPNTPTNFVVSSITNSGVTLSWAAGAAGDCPTTGYELEAEDPHGQVVWRNGRITATTATVTGLTPGTEYTASVIAWGSSCRDYSDYVYATFTTTGAAPTTATPTATATPSAGPNTPTNFVVSSITNSGVTLSWAAGAAGDCPTTGYELDAEDTHGQVDWESGSITATTATVTGLTPGTEYTASILAWGSSCRDYSDYAYATFTTTGGSPTTATPTPTATATPSARPNTPTNVVVSSITSSAAILTWAAGADGNCPTTQYEATIEDPDGKVVWRNRSITATTATVTGLTPGAEYMASVIAFSSTCGSYSDDYAYVTFTTTATTTPPPPSGPLHEFDGSVRIDGRPAAAGTSLLAVVDGQSCGTATVTSSSTYILHVSTECAEDGDTVYFITVHFIVGVHVAVETGTYATGTRTALNLTVNTGMGADDMEEPAEPGMGDGDGDMPAIEVTLWRSVADPSVLYLSTRPAGGSWRTEQAPLDMSRLSRSGRFHRSNATTVMVLLTGGGRVNVEVTVWRSVTNPSILYLSTRPEGGSWRTEQAPLDMSRLSRSGRFHQSNPITIPTAPETLDAASP